VRGALRINPGIWPSNLLKLIHIYVVLKEKNDGVIKPHELVDQKVENNGYPRKEKKKKEKNEFI
jgi:hypothetical protein